MNASENTEKKSAPWALIGLLFSIAAVGTHIYLAIQGFKLRAGLAEKSVCNISSAFNCDAVALSPFAQFLGMPIAVWGAVTNTVLAIFLLIYMLNMSNQSERIERAMYWLSALVLAASLVMGTISTLFLHTFCLFCIATYAFSLIQFVSVHFLQSTSAFAHLGDDIKKTFSEQLWIAVLILAIPVGTFLANSMMGDAFGFAYAKQAVQESQYDWARGPVQTFSSDGLKLKKGSTESKMVIVEFADFLCTHCKHAAPTLHNFVESRPDVEFIFKFFPLDGTCNNSLGGGGKGDGLRCQIAGAVLCADTLGNKGWVAHDYFFERQANMTLSGFAKNLEEVSATTGIGLDSMKACVDSQETMDKLIKSAEEGGKAKIQGTPSIFVNGKLLPRAQFFPVLEAVYNELTK